MYNMGYEAAENFNKDGIRWVSGYGSLYAAMILVTFFLIDIEIRSGAELLAYVIINKKYTHRLLSFNPVTNLYSTGHSFFNIILAVFSSLGKFCLLILAIMRLAMPFAIELMIMI